MLQLGAFMTPNLPHGSTSTSPHMLVPFSIYPTVNSISNCCPRVLILGRSRKCLALYLTRCTISLNFKHFFRNSTISRFTSVYCLGSFWSQCLLGGLDDASQALLITFIDEKTSSSVAIRPLVFLTLNFSDLLEIAGPNFSWLILSRST